MLEVFKSFVCVAITSRQFIYLEDSDNLLEKKRLADNFCGFFFTKTFSFKSSDVQTTEDLFLYVNSIVHNY